MWAEIAAKLEKLGYDAGEIEGRSLERVHALWIQDQLYLPESSNPEEYWYLGLYHLTHGRLEEAVEIYRQGKELGCDECKDGYRGWVFLLQTPTSAEAIDFYQANCETEENIYLCALLSHLEFLIQHRPTERKKILFLAEVAFRMNHSAGCWAMTEILTLLRSVPDKQLRRKGRRLLKGSARALHCQGCELYRRIGRTEEDVQLAISYLKQAYSLGERESVNHLIAIYYQRRDYPPMIELCDQLLTWNAEDSHAHNYLTCYHIYQTQNSEKIFFHGWRSLSTSRSSLETWCLAHPSKKAFRLGLQIHSAPIISKCLYLLPITPEYIQLLLSVSTDFLSKAQRQLKQSHLQSCFEFYRYAPTYFSRYCVLDVQRLIRQYVD